MLTREILTRLFLNQILANWNITKNIAYLNDILLIRNNSARGGGDTRCVSTGKLAGDKFSSLATASLFLNQINPRRDPKDVLICSSNSSSPRPIGYKVGNEIWVL